MKPKKKFFSITESAVDAVSFNTNGISALLASGLSTFQSMVNQFSLKVEEVYQEIHLIEQL